MLKILKIILMMILCGSAAAQELVIAKNYPKSHASSSTVAYPLPLGQEYKPGLKMKKAGRALTICGGVALVGGIILMSGADDYYYNTGSSTNGGSYEEGDARGAFGLLLTVAGTGMSVTGIILWSKGKKKYDRYLEKKKSVSFRPGSRRLTLAYSF